MANETDQAEVEPRLQVDRDLLRLECLRLAVEHQDVTPDGVLGQAERMFAFVVGADREAEAVAQSAQLENAFEAAKKAALWAVTYGLKGAIERGEEGGLDWLKLCMDIEFTNALPKTAL